MRKETWLRGGGQEVSAPGSWAELPVLRRIRFWLHRTNNGNDLRGGGGVERNPGL